MTDLYDTFEEALQDWQETTAKWAEQFEITAIADEEYGFSKNRCDCCQSPLAGDRRVVNCSWTAFDEAVGFEKDHWTMELVCTDCVLWIANGDEPEAPYGMMR